MKILVTGNLGYVGTVTTEYLKNQGYEVIEIEEVIGETKEDCKFREQCWIEFYGTENLINKYSASGLDKEKKKIYLKNKKIYNKKYEEENKEKRKEYHKEYRQQNKEYKKQYLKEYREKQKLLLNSINLNTTVTI